MIRNYFNKALLLAGGLLATQLQADAQCTCGTGADGAYTASSNTTLASGTYNFTSFTIDPGVTVTVTGNQPLVIYATGNVTINGTLSANGGNGGDGITYTSGGIAGLGVAGGADGAAGNYSGSTGPLPGAAGLGPGAGGAGGNWSGGGGAGYSVTGQDASPTDGLGGPSYNDTLITMVTGGSGGGGGSGGYGCGSGGGGGGGGYISITTCTTMTIASGALISANGGNGGSDGTGNCGGGGAGSGGSIVLQANSIVNDGMVTALGGNGGASMVAGPPYYGTGGSGATGRIRFDYTTISGSGSATPSAANGTLKTTPSQTAPASCATSCDGSADANASGGSQSYTYMWMPGGQTTAAITNLCPGTYTVTITDTRGCTATNTVTIGTADLTAPVPDASSLSTVTGQCTATVTAVPTATDNCVGSVNGTTSDPLTYNTPGTYNVTWTYDDGSGNTSTQTQQVVVAGPDTSLMLSGATLTANATPATYQWWNCATNSVIAGETGQSFTPIANGNYALIVTENGCTDTSACFNITTVGIQEQQDNTARVYPNPTAGSVMIELDHAVDADLTVQNVFGQEVRSMRMNGQQLMLDLSSYDEGVYFVNIKTTSSVQVIKVTKTK